MSRRAAFSNLFAVVVAAMAWSALLLQYWLMAWPSPTLATTVAFLSFFTILSNLLVAFVAGSAATGGGWAVLRWWRGPRMRGLAALSITVTCLVYATLLQHLWQPQGPQLWADRALHYVVPVLYVAWWALSPGHRALRWGDALRWLLFPALFAAWTFARGAVTGQYPYPFMDVGQLGYLQVMLNAAGVGLLFLLLGLTLVAADRKLPL
ncbi:Pr6Pr family membrane protein [Bacillus sp. NP157]|nr:Pr6Pr family membrane protein [Bacillus sp. NP157]